MQLNLGGTNNVSSNGIVFDDGTYYTWTNYSITTCPTWSIVLQYTPTASPDGIRTIVCQPFIDQSMKFIIGYFSNGYYAGYYKQDALHTIGPFSLNVGKSTNIVLADDGSNLTLYVGKQQIGSSIQSSGLTNGNPILIGNNTYSNGPGIVGSIQYLKFFDRGLSSSDVQNL